MSVDDILKDLSKNMVVFKNLKEDQMKGNAKHFLNLYWLISETAARSSDVPMISPKDKKQISFLLELGYKAGYVDALK